MKKIIHLRIPAGHRFWVGDRFGRIAIKEGLKALLSYPCRLLSGPKIAVLKSDI